MAEYIYDIETYKNLFSLSIIREDGKHRKSYRVDKFVNQFDEIMRCLDFMEDNEHVLVGFNSLNFDSPIIHSVLKNRRKLRLLSGQEIAAWVFDRAQEQINSFKDDRFGKTLKPSEEKIPQIDLFKVHHFDNRARSTSLKMLEFNMRMKNIADLPYDIHAELTDDMIKEIIAYNEHDVEATRLFFHASKPMIEFRKQLTQKYGKSFMNHNDGKIGKDYFIMKLEEELPGSCYSIDHKGKRHINQTKRPKIHLKDCLFDYYDFKRPEFVAVLDWFRKQTITETKGVFSDIDEADLGAVAEYAELTEKRQKFKAKPTQQQIHEFMLEHPKGWIQEEELKATENVIQPDGTKVKVPKKSYWKHWRVAETLNVVVDGFRFDFGTGGIHGSLLDTVARETAKYKIVDADVSSMYPNIAIANRVYPKHLSEKFCDIYKDVYEQRKSYPKGSPENAMLKLALNSVYGDSNNKYSPFYDPQYTMTITINGQLSLCLLAEKLLDIKGLKLIQVNTDGVTVAYPKGKDEEYLSVCNAWQKQVGLDLEYADYTSMWIRDVNNYVAWYTNGKVKRKGAYQYEDLGWHQNQSALIIPMAAEAAMLHGKDIEEFIRSHKNEFDFMLRTKVPRSSSLILRYEDGREEAQQNICRYYPSKNGGKLIKIMPALEGKEEAGDRELSIDAAYTVKTCNDMKDFSWEELDYDYYVAEAKKLLVGVNDDE